MKQKEHRKILIYAAIIIAQVLVMIYWAHIKTNYNIDELYSMGFARGYFSQIHTPEYITVDNEFCFNQWMSNSTLKGYLIMKDKAKIINVPIGVVIKEFLTGRNYFGLLNIAESFADNSDLSSIPGEYLNVVFFVIAQIMLIIFMNRIGMCYETICLATGMFGFSGYIISAVEFVRFYMLIIMLTLVITNLLFSAWNENSMIRITLVETVVMVLSYFIYKNSDFYVPFFGALMACFLFGLAFKKRWKESIPLVIVILIGVLFILLRTGLFGYDSVAVMPLKVRRTVSDLLNPSIIGVIRYTKWLIKLFATHYFGNYLVNVLYLTVLLFCFYSVIRRSKKADSVLIKRPLAPEVQFVLIIAGATFVYTVFNAICQYDVWRYYCFGFVFVTFLFWFIIDRLLLKLQNNMKKWVVIILTALVGISSLLPFRTRMIEYMYEDEKSFIENLQKVSYLDVVMFLPANEETILSEELTYLSRHAIYDCISLMPEESSIYVADIEEYDRVMIDFPEDFILWTQKDQGNMDLAPVLDDLDTNGYSVRSLGTDHDSLVFLVRRSADM